MSIEFEPGLPLPEGCLSAKMIGNMREVSQYVIQEEALLFRWDVLMNGTRYHKFRYVGESFKFPVDLPRVREEVAEEFKKEILKDAGER